MVSEIDYETLTADVLIIGSGGAGMRSAIAAAAEDVNVKMVTKGRWGKDGTTIAADGEMAVDSRSLHERFGLPDTNPEDSKETFFEDAVRAGKFLNNQRLVEIQVKEAPDRLAELLNWGLEIKEVWHTAGHSYPRGAYVSPTRLISKLKSMIRKTNVGVCEDAMVTDLLTNKDRVVGAVGVNSQGKFVVFRAKSVILATGGAMRQYPLTTAPEKITGDGQAMAFRAGAELIDMEFPMFLPGAFVWPPAVKGVDVPFQLSTAGIIQGHLLNRRGERFMKKWDPENLEHTTRDIASVAMMNEILKGEGSPHGGVYVSLKHLPGDLIKYWLESVAPKEWVLEYGGFDMRDYMPRLNKNAIESAPASHYFNGGIKINEKAKTNLESLFAAGEVTGGVHGGNRLSGNAFTEFLVWGKRAGKQAAKRAKQTGLLEFKKNQVESLLEKVEAPLRRKSGADPFVVRKSILKLAWKKIGVIRTIEGLKEALSKLQNIKKKCKNLATRSNDRLYNLEWQQALELENMRLVLKMTAKAGIERKESRASHYLRELPETDYANWTKNCKIKLVNGKMWSQFQPATVTRLSPSKKKLPFGETE